MKPIFKEERAFLEKKLNAEIPVNSWRNGSKIYLNHFDKKPFLTYKVDLLNDSLIIKKYDEPNLSDNLTLEEEYEKILKDYNSKEKRAERYYNFINRVADELGIMPDKVTLIIKQLRFK